MSINVSVGFQIPTNVVEVGNEITTQQLGAITSGSSPTSANPFTTVSYVSGLYATKASPTFTGTVTIPAGASISGYLTTASASSTYQTISGMSSYATQTYVTTRGYITSSALSGYATESFVYMQNYLTDAPSDGNEYVRKNAAWAVATGGGSGGISDAPSDGSYYARYNASWISFTIPTVPPASVTNIDLTGNFNGYSMGSGYYSFKYDSTENTMRIQDGVGKGTTVGIKGIEEPVTDISIGQTLDATHSRILNVLSTYTISIPSDSTYSFPIGTRFFICSPSGATVDAMMTSASINGVVGGNYTLPNGVSTLIKVAADTWYIS